MNAEPLLRRVTALLAKHRLDAVLIGLDFMVRIAGIRSFEGLRARADTARFGDHVLRAAPLADIIKSKQAADRPQDRAVLPLLRRTLREKHTG